MIELKIKIKCYLAGGRRLTGLNISLLSSEQQQASTRKFEEIRAFDVADCTAHSIRRIIENVFHPLDPSCVTELQRRRHRG